MYFPAEGVVKKIIGRIKNIWIRKVICRSDPIRYARALGVRIGVGCRLLTDVDLTFGSEPYLISIGDHVSVTGGVRFITHDGGVWVFRRSDPAIDYFGRIVIGDNVFIGMNSLVMPGVTIGSNSIIGAGSIVNNDVPPNTVVAGVPARFIMSIDDYRTSRRGFKVEVRGLSECLKRKKIEAFLCENLGRQENIIRGD